MSEQSAEARAELRRELAPDEQVERLDVERRDLAQVHGVNGLVGSGDENQVDRSGSDLSQLLRRVLRLHEPDLEAAVRGSLRELACDQVAARPGRTRAQGDRARRRPRRPRVQRERNGGGREAEPDHQRGPAAAPAQHAECVLGPQRR